MKSNIVDENILFNKAGFAEDIFALLSQLDRPATMFDGNKNDDFIYHQAEDNIFNDSSILNGISFANVVNQANANTIGIDNTSKIATRKGEDAIIGISIVAASSQATAISQGAGIFDDRIVSSDSQSVAIVNTLAIGIDNSGKIATRKGNDSIVGIANTSALSDSTAISQAEATVGNESFANANSESVAIVDTLAIGIDNSSVISTNKGDDLIVGIANISASTQATGISKAYGFTSNATQPQVANDIETAIAESVSTATANNQTNTFGIFNSGRIISSKGNDVIFGLADSASSNNAETLAEAEAEAVDRARTKTNAESISMPGSVAVGIVNVGLITTGKGTDTIIGIASNDPTAAAFADATAIAVANSTVSDTNTISIADTLNTIAIGIDNSSGKIDTGKGDDRIVGYGNEIGILGGKIDTGKGNDRIVYGGAIGIQNSIIHTGKGHDYLQAAIVDVEPLTGEAYLSANQTSSIRDAEIFGNTGNDTFEIGGFEGKVLIDGGKDFDVLKLSGSIDDYEIIVGSSNKHTLTIENGDSILTARKIEALYFGDSPEYSFDYFA